VAIDIRPEVLIYRVRPGVAAFSVRPRRTTWPGPAASPPAPRPPARAACAGRDGAAHREIPSQMRSMDCPAANFGSARRRARSISSSLPCSSSESGMVPSPASTVLDVHLPWCSWVLCRNPLRTKGSLVAVAVAVAGQPPGNPMS
jgi:hypothetical protein